MTRQEAFDKVWNGLASQGFEKSLIPDSDGIECAYRGEDGKRCAAGWLIPDWQYDPSMERKAIITLVDQGLVTGLDQSMGMFLERLQDAHDHAASPESMREALRAIAIDHNLLVPDTRTEES